MTSTIRVTGLAALLAASTAACAANSAESGHAGERRDEAVSFATCTAGVMPQDLPTTSWNRFVNRFVTQGGAWHAAQDVLVATGKPAELPAKFSYGAFSKDLEGEDIEVWIDDCSGGFRFVGEDTTNGDGRISLELRAPDVPGIGEYNVYYRVKGDNTGVRSTLRVYPAGTSFVVFDIDATLTTSDSELFGEVLADIVGGDIVPEARPGALDITELRHDGQDYEIIYLTGRPYLLTENTRDWLADLGFPSGTLRVTDEVTLSWPSESAVGAYKAGYLKNVVLAQGFAIYAAYGNATTDIYAYEEAGVAKDHTFIADRHGGERGTVAVGDSYYRHIDDIAGEDPVSQPFFR